MGSTQDKITINKNGVNMVLNTRKLNIKSTMFYLKARRSAPEGLKPREANINISEEKNLNK